LAYCVAEFSTLNPGTAYWTLSSVATVQLPGQSAMAATWISMDWIGRPIRRGGRELVSLQAGIGVTNDQAHMPAQFGKQ
jgi:hypothetical protein